MRILYLLYAFFVTCLQSLSLHAHDTKGWTMTNFNNENGLPQSSIIAIEKDKDGYLWMTTHAGIVRYEGRRFRLFDNTNSALQSNRYMKFGQDEQGRIFCLDERYQLSYYNTSAGFTKPVYIPSMLVATGKGLIDIRRIDMRRMERDTLTYKYSQRVVSRHFVYHATGREKGFIVLHGDIVGYFSNGRIQRTDSLHYHRHIYENAAGSVDGKLCYISKDRDIVLIDSNGVQSRHKIPVPIPWNKLLLNMPVLSFSQQEHQLLLNVDGDIYEVRLTGNRLSFHSIIKVNIPSITSIRYYPAENLLAIGSSTQGLFLFRRKQMTSLGVNDSNADAFYALAPYGNNQLFTTAGIMPGNRPIPGILDAINRHTILYDHNGNYWYASWYSLRQMDKHFRMLKNIPLIKPMKCIQEDEQGTVWLTQSENNFGRIQADTFQPYTLASIAEKSIACFIPAGKQTFWLVGKGLCMWLNVQTHEQRIYHQFDNIELRTAYLDKQGNLWLGSYGQGYYLFRNGRFIKMPEDESHHLKIVNCFLQDRQGFMWMTTNNGLFQSSINDLYQYVSGTTKQVYHHYYGKESGLKSSEFNGGCNPSGLQLANGLFAFPSMSGIVLFNPDSTQPLLPANKLFFEQAMLDGKPVAWKQLLNITPSFKRLELNISSPYFGNLKNLDIQYNIEGLDDRWYSLNENNRIVLNTLKYGHYQLRLRKQAGFGSGNYITAELPMFVRPFFYQTWWFRILAVVCVAVLFVLIVKIRYRYLIRQRNRLEAEVKDRTNELAYHTRLMEKLAVMIAHDLKSPLHFISKVTGHLRNSVQQHNLQGIDRISGELKHTADQVYQFVEGFNLWAASFGEGFSLNKTSFKLNDLLQELELFFKDILKADNNNLVMVTHGHYILHTDRELLKIILRNIIDNANKHGQHCSITLSVALEPRERIAITIADNGDGMQEAMLKRIQDRIAQATTAASVERNSRLGYQMIIDFATRIEACLEVQSIKGTGTTVTLRLSAQPAGKASSEDLSQQIVSAG